jgi:putative beta-1,4-xylosyltransferase IRX9
MITLDDLLWWFLDFIQFIPQMTTEDGIKIMIFQCNCSESQIMQWHLEMPRFTQIIEEQEPQQQQNLIETGGRPLAIEEALEL